MYYGYASRGAAFCWCCCCVTTFSFLLLQTRYVSDTSPLPYKREDFVLLDRYRNSIKIKIIYIPRISSYVKKKKTTFNYKINFLFLFSLFFSFFFLIHWFPSSFLLRDSFLFFFPLIRFFFFLFFSSFFPSLEGVTCSGWTWILILFFFRSYIYIFIKKCFYSE